MPVSQPTDLDVEQLTRSLGEAIRRCELDLSGARLLTEAATGAYVVTPVLAAEAGAEVWAVARESGGRNTGRADGRR